MAPAILNNQSPAPAIRSSLVLLTLAPAIQGSLEAMDGGVLTVEAMQDQDPTSGLEEPGAADRTHTAIPPVHTVILVTLSNV